MRGRTSSAIASMRWPAARAAGSAIVVVSRRRGRRRRGDTAARCRGRDARRRRRDGRDWISGAIRRGSKSYRKDQWPAPLIVTAELGPADFAWLEGLRRAHFPPERNQLPAHLTMFHALPPSAEGEVRQPVGASCASSRRRGHRSTGLMNLGGGVAFRVVSDGLDRIRDRACRAFPRLADRAGCGRLAAARHDPEQGRAAEARALACRRSEASFAPRPLAIRGLALHRYLGGPWETLANVSVPRAS